MEETLSSNTATITRSRPKPLNFGLDQREQEMLHRQNLAIRAMQEASTTHNTNIDARNMLFAADQARTTGWLNVHNDSDPAHSLTLCPPLMLYNTRSMLLTSETHQQQHNLQHHMYFAHRWNSTQLLLLMILLL